jgi:hypothetical protein
MCETSAFLERKESLINRLFKSRLPIEPNGDNKDDLVVLDDLNSKPPAVKPISFQETPRNEIVFFDDFIPIESNSNSTKQRDKFDLTYSPEIEPSDYTGPYSPSCILKVRKSLIAELTNNRTGQTTNRRLEIAKIKVNIPSKFDNDNKLKRKLDYIQSKRTNDFDDHYENLQKQSKKKPQSTKFVDDMELIDLTAESDHDVEYIIDSKCSEFENYIKRSMKPKSNKKLQSEKCEELKANYRELRLQRKLLLRKKNKNPSAELDAKEKNVFDDMKKIRKNLKKLRKKPGRKFNRNKNSTFKSKQK